MVCNWWTRFYDNTGLIGSMDYMESEIKHCVFFWFLCCFYAILWKSNQIMKLNFKEIGYYIVLGVFASLMIIGVDVLLIT